MQSLPCTQQMLIPNADRQASVWH